MAAIDRSLWEEDQECAKMAAVQLAHRIAISNDSKKEKPKSDVIKMKYS